MAGLKNSGNLNATEISQIFKDYVTRMQDKERHTRAAVKETDAFDTYCASEFPNNVRLQVALFDRMMNCAVEYELSGFIAGFQTAATIFANQESQLPKPAENPLNAKCSAKSQKHNISIQAVEKRVSEKMKEEEANLDCITSKKIAELFQTSNWRIVRRIEEKILPNCSEQQKAGFVKIQELNCRHRHVDIYKLDHNACKLYFEHMSSYKSNVLVAGGLGRMEELMKTVFYKPENEKRIAFCL